MSDPTQADRPNASVCPFCQKSFASKQYRDKHVILIHEVRFLTMGINLIQSSFGLQ